ncbi:hypothetical protein PCE1_002552 [Barthelona sp. PCE]
MYVFNFQEPNTTHSVIVEMTQFVLHKRKNVYVFDGDECGTDSDYLKWDSSNRLCGDVGSFNILITNNFSTLKYYTSNYATSSFTMSFETVENTAVTQCTTGKGVCYNDERVYEHSEFNAFIAEITVHSWGFILAVIGVTFFFIALLGVMVWWYAGKKKTNRTIVPSDSRYNNNKV